MKVIYCALVQGMTRWTKQAPHIRSTIQCGVKLHEEADAKFYVNMNGILK